MAARKTSSRKSPKRKARSSKKTVVGKNGWYKDASGVWRKKGGAAKKASKARKAPRKASPKRKAAPKRKTTASVKRRAAPKRKKAGKRKRSYTANSYFLPNARKRKTTSSKRKRSSTMTKTDMAAHIAERVHAPKSVVTATFNELAALATKELKSRGSFQVPGLAKLKVAKVKARTFTIGGKTRKVKAGKTVRCRAGAAVKNAIRGKR